MYRLEKIPIKRRARHTRNGRSYVDAKTRADMDAVRDAYDGALYLCPVALSVTIYKQLPKRTPKSVEELPFTVRPDIDNVAKCVMDALNGVAYADDRQVIEIHAAKLPRRREGGEWCAFDVVPMEAKHEGT